MREVEEALARAYAQRGASDHSAVPPAPHLVARVVEVTGSDAHAEVEPEPVPSAPATSLFWPSTIRTLERQYGDRFARLADALIEARDQKRLKVLLFTSCHRAEGRTTLVLTLARALARRTGRTLLVDADLTGPMLARQLGLLPTLGLDNVIDDGVALSDALIEAPDDN